MVFLCDLVETSEINAELEGAIFFADEENWSYMGRRRLLDKAIIEVFIEEVPKRSLFGWEKGVQP